MEILHKQRAGFTRDRGERRQETFVGSIGHGWSLKY
jgi:hypothetical protein